MYVWKIGNVLEFNFLQSKLVSSYKWLLFTESKKDTYITSSTQRYDHWVRMGMVKIRNLFLIPVILYLYFCSIAITTAPQCLLSNAFKIEAKQGKISWTGKRNNTLDAFGHLVDCLFVALIILLFVAFVCFYPKDICCMDGWLWSSVLIFLFQLIVFLHYCQCKPFVNSRICRNWKKNTEKP